MFLSLVVFISGVLFGFPKLIVFACWGIVAGLLVRRRWFPDIHGGS